MINSSREQTQDKSHEIGYRISQNYKWNPHSSNEILISDDGANISHFERPKTSQMATRSQLIGKEDVSKGINSKTPTITFDIDSNKTPMSDHANKYVYFHLY